MTQDWRYCMYSMLAFFAREIKRTFISFSVSLAQHAKRGFPITWRMASLCISCPAHAGTMSLSTRNSSFIFSRRRRSMMLCAVLRAILRPALAPPGCFLFPPAPAAGSAGALGAGGAVCVFLSSWGWVLGFIWIIFRERVGGGGRAVGGEASLAWRLARRLRGVVEWSESRAEGGRVKEGSICFRSAFSLAEMSVDGAGVGGKVMGMMMAVVEEEKDKEEEEEEKEEKRM